MMSIPKTSTLEVLIFFMLTIHIQVTMITITHINKAFKVRFNCHLVK